MRPTLRLLSLASLAVGAALAAAACSSSVSTPTSTDVASSAPASAGAAASITLGSTNDPTLGGYLTGSGGMTLYIFTNDTPDTSTCTGTCATSWPPLTVASGAEVTGPAGATGSFATIGRPDGTVQVTYNHMPLYYFAGDSVAGDTNGQGQNGIWFVASVSGSGPSAAVPSAAASAAPSDTAPAASASPAPSTSAVSSY